MGFPAASDERGHDAAGDETWADAWLFDVVDHQASLALSIEFVLWPVTKRVAFHASLLREGQSLISLVDLEAPAPKTPSLEVRAPGLWTDIGIQTALEHLTVDIEAFAVELEDPADVFAGAYGIRTALGCELEWETDADIVADAARSYQVPCVVHGELLIDELTVEVDGWGWRSHQWGPVAEHQRMGARGRSSDGEWWLDQAGERELTMRALGEAPVPDPYDGDVSLRQYWAASDEGATAWIRRSELDPERLSS